MCRSAHKLVRQVPPRPVDAGSSFCTPATLRIQTLAMRVQTASFSCLMLVVAKTQSEEQFFDNFVFKEKSAAPDQQFWCNVIDCLTSIDFESSSTFETVYIGGHFKSNLSSCNRGSDIVSSLPVRGLLSQYLLRSSSQLLSRSNIKKVFSESQARYTQSQTQDISMIPLSQLPSTEGGRGRSFKENPVDTFSSLSQSIVINSRESPLDSEKRNDYDLDGQNDGTPVMGLDDVKIALEQNHLNQQRCMGTLVRVIERMRTLFEGKWDDSVKNGTVPFWISVCRDKLCDYSEIPSGQTALSGLAMPKSIDVATKERKNIRLFMLRLLMNQPVASIVAPFVPGTLLKPMIDCCLHDLCGVTCSDSGPILTHSESSYHYMIRDFVFSIVDSWPSALCDFREDIGGMFGVPSLSLLHGTVSKSASAFLSYLIRHMITEDNISDATVVTDNIRSLCALVKLWVGGVPGKSTEYLVRDGLDLSPIVELISSDVAPTGGAHATASSRGSINVRKRLAGLEVLLCLQNAGYPVLSVGNEVERCWAQKLLHQVCSGCKYPRKEVSVFSGSVVGSFLSFINSPRESNTFSTKRVIEEASNLAQLVEAKLNSIFVIKNGEDIVVSCVRAILQECQSFMTRELLLKLFARFGALSQKTRADFLEILCLCDFSPENSQFDGIVVVDYMKPYLSMLLNDATVFPIGRGAQKRSIPLVQVLAIRLLRLNSQKCVERNVLSTLVMGQENSGQVAAGVGGGIVKCIEESSQLEVRQEAFALLMSLHSEVDKTLGAEGRPSAASTKRLKWQLGVLRILLLRGLTDPDDRGMLGTPDDMDSADNIFGIRKQIFNYFEANFGMRSCPLSRLKVLMSDLFDPIGSLFSAEDTDRDEDLLVSLQVNDEWLRYCSYLLLATCRFSDHVGLPSKLFSRGLAPEEAYRPMQVFMIETEQ